MRFLKWIYDFRGFWVAPPILISLICFYSEIESDILILSLGIPTMFIGTFIRIWSQQHLHYRLPDSKILTTTGPYEFVRNPIYIGNTFICVGATILSELLWLVPITFIWCIGMYSLVIRYEESKLLKKYGQAYQQYMSEIPRWIPFKFRSKNVGLITKYFYHSVIVEIHCLLLVLIFVFKETLESWFKS